ncbi:MAG TPA: type II toxin-antitoxin system death-on-curing family toxin [Candidatus Saccharimonadales bacterium]|nr:type II toxin-antitoxin system death-on-curing family toxin [Candidatus Saccharimonadales bacterium]
MFGLGGEYDYDILLILHDHIIEASGGAKGIHSEHLLRSALSRPLQTAFGEEIHSDSFMQAAALLDAIANNHGFRDGNKRTAMAAATLSLFTREKMKLSSTNQEYEDFMLHVVRDKPPMREISDWLERHCSNAF